MRNYAKYGRDWRGMINRMRVSPLGTTPREYGAYDNLQRLWVYNKLCKFSTLERWSLVALWARSTGRKPPLPPKGWRLWREHHYSQSPASARAATYMSQVETAAFDRRTPMVRDIVGAPLGDGASARRTITSRHLVGKAGTSRTVALPSFPRRRRTPPQTAGKSDWMGRSVIVPGQRPRIAALKLNGKMFVQCWVYARNTVALKPTPYHQLGAHYVPCTKAVLFTGGDTGRPRPPVYRRPSLTAPSANSGIIPSASFKFIQGSSSRPKPLRWNPPRALPKNVIAAALKPVL